MLTREEILEAKAEDYMNDAQLAFFKQRLLQEKQQIVTHLHDAKHDLSSTDREFDELDQALHKTMSSFGDLLE